jgi:hypothetical protein
VNRSSIRAPYRGHDLPPPPRPPELPAPNDEDFARVVGFIWVTALVRFVIVLHRHEVFTADPIFAALLTFGVPAALLVMAAVAVVRWLRAVVRALLSLDQVS